MDLNSITSSIYNDVVSGLSGMNVNPNMSLEQLEDEVVEMRLAVIKEYYLKGLLRPKDLGIAINCIELDCKDPAKCCNNPSGKTAMHFEIPQLVDDFGDDAILYIGSTDRQQSFKVYTNPTSFKYNKYKARGAEKPYVYLEKTPNENKMYDG